QTTPWMHRFFCAAQIHIGGRQGDNIDVRFCYQIDDRSGLISPEGSEAGQVPQSDPAVVARIDSLLGNICGCRKALVRCTVRQIPMKIDVTAELLGQFKNDIDMRFTVLPTNLGVGTPADDIRSHLDRFSHQLKCSRRLQYSFLWKGDDLQIDQLRVLLSEV